MTTGELQKALEDRGYRVTYEDVVTVYLKDGADITDREEARRIILEELRWNGSYGICGAPISGQDGEEFRAAPGPEKDGMKNRKKIRKQ